MTTEVVETSSRLSEWWSTETENVLQRIERWAAYVRGYNRLRSERLSKGEEQWTYFSNFHLNGSDAESLNTMRKSNSESERKMSEEMKINYCSRTINYKSNQNLESNCLEIYSYDHSIYFKTIGDLRRSKNILNGNKTYEVNSSEDWHCETWKAEVDDNCEGTEVPCEIQESNNNHPMSNLGVRHLFT